MNFSFISVVSLVVPDTNIVNNFLANMSKLLKNNFSDFEIILVNNKEFNDLREVTKSIDPEFKKEVTVLNLSKVVNEDNAIFAGLERANGDYTVYFNMNFYDNCNLVLDLYDKSQKNTDIVYLKHKDRELTFVQKIIYSVYKFIIGNLSKLNVDITIDKTRIISRRALNALLQMRETTRNFKGSFSYLGFESKALPVDFYYEIKPHKGLYKQIKDGINSLVSFTEVLNKLVLVIFIVSILFSFMVCLDAILVKFWQVDLFGTVTRDHFSGYPFLVIMISIMFTLTCLILFLISLYLDVINKEIRRRPSYFIESIYRL